MIVFDILSIDYFHSSKILFFYEWLGRSEREIFFVVKFAEQVCKVKDFCCNSTVKQWKRLVFKGPRRILRCLSLITFNELIRDRSFFVGLTDSNQQQTTSSPLFPTCLESINFNQTLLNRTTRFISARISSKNIQKKTLKTRLKIEKRFVGFINIVFAFIIFGFIFGESSLYFVTNENSRDMGTFLSCFFFLKMWNLRFVKIIRGCGALKSLLVVFGNR